MSVIMRCFSVRPQFLNLIWNWNGTVDGGICQKFEHCNYQSLIDVCSLVVHFLLWFLEVFDPWWCNYKHKNMNNFL